MLDLDVEVEGAFTSVALGALGIGAGQGALYLIGASPVVLLSSRKVPLSSRALQVLVIIVKLLDLDNVLQSLVSLFCGLADLGQQLLVFEVEAPVAFEIVLLGVKSGQL